MNSLDSGDIETTVVDGKPWRQAHQKDSAKEIGMAVLKLLGVESADVCGFTLVVDAGKMPTIELRKRVLQTPLGKCEVKQTSELR